MERSTELIESSKLKNFKNEMIIKNKNKSKSILFHHPSTVKIIGKRGKGKTNFIVNYLNSIDIEKLYVNLFFITESKDQLLYNYIIKKNKFKFLTLEESIPFIKQYKEKTLFIMDDCSLGYEKLKKAHRLSVDELYIRGRHMNISLFCLEQDFIMSNNDQRRNTDYFVLFNNPDNIVTDTINRQLTSQFIPSSTTLRYLLRKYEPIIITPESDYPVRIHFNKYVDFITDDKFEIKEIIKEVKFVEPIKAPVILNEQKIKRKYKTHWNDYIWCALGCLFCLPCICVMNIKRDLLDEE